MNDQERKTRIAFLQNRQAELETEIQILKQSQQFERLITEEPTSITTCNIDPEYVIYHYNIRVFPSAQSSISLERSNAYTIKLFIKLQVQ